MSWEIHEAAERIAEGWYSELEETRKRNAVLGRENAKLRELVRELLPCYQWSDCYDGCMAADGPLCPNPAKLTERARELGIEVGDAREQS